MKTVWKPARRGDTPGELVPGEGDVPILNPCVLAKIRLTTLALGRKRVSHLRRGWSGPVFKRYPTRRPAGTTFKGSYR